MAEMNQPKKAPATKSAMLEDLGEGIPVHSLHFKDVTTLPDGKAIRTLFAGQRPDGIYEVTYYPRARHHRIVITPIGSATPRVVMIHETWALWEPAG